MTRTTVASHHPWKCRAYLRVEQLGERIVPSISAAEPVFPMVMAGELNGLPGDSPAERIDPNSPESPFAGVGSIQVLSTRGRFTGTATAIGPRHILTAAHVVDLNSDGKANGRDGL